MGPGAATGVATGSVASESWVKVDLEAEAATNSIVSCAQEVAATACSSACLVHLFPKVHVVETCRQGQERYQKASLLPLTVPQPM